VDASEAHDYLVWPISICLRYPRAFHVAGTGIPTMIGGEGQLHKSGGMRHWCPRGSKSFRHGLTSALDKARPLGSILLQWPGPGRWLFVASSWISTSSRVLILHLRPPYFQRKSCCSSDSGRFGLNLSFDKTVLLSFWCESISVKVAS
jgi:hypothetical protein